jgi:Mrp family chromosome partitioning ATPase
MHPDGGNMSEENCDHECEGCAEADCPSRQPLEKLKPHKLSSFGKTIAIISGKGGVGKSLVTSLLGAKLAKEGHATAILDADVTGPSIPKAFGMGGYAATGDENAIFPAETKSGLAIISANYFLEDPSSPIIFRGPMISNLVGQLYSQVAFGKREFLLIDMPPGTGDVPLTVFQQIPIDGVIVVSSPQDLVSEVVGKSVRMAAMMGVKVLGLVENMAYAVCPHCGERFDLFGGKDPQDTAKLFGLPLLDEIPLDPRLAQSVDEGKIETCDENYLAATAKMLEKM